MLPEKKELSGDAGSHTDELQTIEKALKILELLTLEAREERDLSN